MSNELKINGYTTGVVLYAVVENAAGQVWNTSTTAFETYTAANIAAYAVALTEQAANTGRFRGNFPTGIVVVGRYNVSAYQRVGASPAVGDTYAGGGDVEWKGSAELSQAADINASTQTLTAGLIPFTGTITDASSTTTVLNTGLTGTGDISGAKVVFTSGALKGIYRTISAINTANGQITLLTALPSAPTSGVNFSVVQGSKALELFLTALGTDSKPLLSATTHTGATVPTVTTVTGAVNLPTLPNVTVGGYATGQDPTTAVAPIKGQTDKLTFTGANVNSVAQNMVADPSSVLTAIKAKTDLLPAQPAAVGSKMIIDLTQAVPLTNTAQTVGDALNAARAAGFGGLTLDQGGNTLTLLAPNGSTSVRVFTLDNGTNPLSRT